MSVDAETEVEGSVSTISKWNGLKPRSATHILRPVRRADLRDRRLGGARARAAPDRGRRPDRAPAATPGLRRKTPRWTRAAAPTTGGSRGARTYAQELPSTNDEFGTLCAQAFDAGCLLTTVVKQLPASDGASPYWYRSDGKAYTLFTRLQTAVEPDNCPAQVPLALASTPTYCLSGGSR
jgi:hypothetical protein